MSKYLFYRKIASVLAVSVNIISHEWPPVDPAAPVTFGDGFACKCDRKLQTAYRRLIFHLRGTKKACVFSERGGGGEIGQKDAQR